MSRLPQGEPLVPYEAGSSVPPDGQCYVCGGINFHTADCPERSVPPDSTDQRPSHQEHYLALVEIRELRERVNQLEKQLSDERDAKQRNEAAMLRLGGKVNQLEQALRESEDAVAEAKRE